MIRLPPSSIAISDSDVQTVLQQISINHQLLASGFTKEDIQRYYNEQQAGVNGSDEASTASLERTTSFGSLVGTQVSTESDQPDLSSEADPALAPKCRLSGATSPKNLSSPETGSHHNTTTFPTPFPPPPSSSSTPGSSPPFMPIALPYRHAAVRQSSLLRYTQIALSETSSSPARAHSHVHGGAAAADEENKASPSADNLLASPITQARLYRRRSQTYPSSLSEADDTTTLGIIQRDLSRTNSPPVEILIVPVTNSAQMVADAPATISRRVGMPRYRITSGLLYGHLAGRSPSSVPVSSTSTPESRSLPEELTPTTARQDSVSVSPRPSRLRAQADPFTSVTSPTPYVSTSRAPQASLTLPYRMRKVRPSTLDYQLRRDTESSTSSPVAQSRGRERRFYNTDGAVSINAALPPEPAFNPNSSPTSSVSLPPQIPNTPPRSRPPISARTEPHHQRGRGNLRVYNDAISAIEQPQTPADLSRRLFLAEDDAAYTAPPGVMRQNVLALARQMEEADRRGQQSPTITLALESRLRELRRDTIRRARMRAEEDSRSSTNVPLRRDEAWREELDGDRIGEENFATDTEPELPRRRRVVRLWGRDEAR